MCVYRQPFGPLIQTSMLYTSIDGKCVRVHIRVKTLEKERENEIPERQILVLMEKRRSKRDRK